MKRILYFLLSAFLVIVLSLKMANAQNNVGINTKSPSTNAALDIKAVGKQGILIPRLKASDTLVAPFNAASLSNKDKGLMFYDTVGTQFLYWNGLNWKSFGGLAGTNGLDGKTVLNGTLDPTAALGINGDFFINTVSNKIFGPKTAGAWPAGVSLVGANGTNGTNGLDGKTVLNGTLDPTAALGVNGDFFINTASNKIFGPKTAGVWPAGVSLVGANGTNGTNGLDGKTVLNDNVDPTSTVGVNGDFFINTVSNKIFGPKTAGVWPAGVSLVGTNGLDGKTVLNGTLDPTAALGVNGDFFINTTSNKIFGPKTAGAWPAGVSLVGTSGLDGKTVLNGTLDPTAALGVNGDFFINTTSNKIFGPKTAGVWPAGISLVGNSGLDGKTVLNGTLDPTAALGVNGDFFINTVSNKIFGPKTAGVWPAGISLVGNSGLDGKTVLNGTLDPTAALGVNGDFFINTVSNKIFGPKTAGVWPAGVSLVGNNGLDGKTVLNGAIDPISTLGINGDFFINTASNKIFGPKTAGVWPAGISLVGTNGLDGKTVLNDNVDPTSTVGVNGDFFINTVSNKIFGPKTAGAWPAGVSLVGNSGLDGKTVLNGTLDPTAALGVNGDFFINTTSNKIFGPKTAGAWPAGVSLVGNSGLDGKTVLNGTLDPTAALGVNGDFFINTVSNKIFGPKTAGVWPAGVSLVGNSGLDGKTVLNGAIDPISTLGLNGDFFINTVSNKIFGPKTAGVWPAGVSLVGTNGLDGKTVLNGTLDPTAALGVNGDFFINTTSNKIFGPKTAGVWPAGVSLVGNSGLDGKTVLNGTLDPTAALGVNGDFFINTVSNKIFGPKAAGAWPAGVSLVGTNGLDGKTVLNGAIDPISTLGINGDFFINTASNKIFGPKTAGAWPAGVSLVGNSGLDGKTVLNGTLDPTAALGVNGDFFINTTSNKIFGPKTAGVWPAGVSLVGNSGLDGKTVLNGTLDPTAALGINGDFFINTVSNKIFGPKTAGAWPATGTSLVGPAGSFSVTGTTGQTIYHDGTDWKATSNLHNDGTKIGIGITPSFMLHVIDNSADPAIFARQGASGPAIQGNNTAGGIGVFGGSFAGSGVYAYIASGGSGTALHAKTDGTGPVGIFEGGNVGIGSLTPNHLLTVDGNAAETNIQLVNDVSGDGTNDGLIFNFDGKNGTIINHEGGILTLGTNASKGLIIGSSGNIQIPSLVGPGVVQADNLGNLSIGTAMSGSGTKNFLPIWSATGSSLGDSRIYDDGSSYVGIGRKTPIFADGYFDIEIPTIGNAYGGMYLNSQSATGKPFYGYSLNSTVVAWNYLDGTTSDWRVNNGALDRLIVKKTGVVQIPDLAGAGSVLADAAGNLSVNKCAFAFTNAAAFKIPTIKTPTTMIFDKKIYDVSGNINSNAFKAPAAGIYHFDATISFDPASAYGIQYKISFYNGTTLVKGVNFASTLTDFSGNISADVELAAGDVITVKIWQDEANGRFTLFGVANCYFSGHRIF